jgi:hypothetical protein
MVKLVFAVKHRQVAVWLLIGCAWAVHFGEFSTGKGRLKINIVSEGNVSLLGASDLVISRGFPEFGPS